MNVRLARIVDYWVGVPLCFLFSLRVRLREAIRSLRGRDAREAVTARKVLFIEFSEIGSAIMAWPAIRSLTESFPGSEPFFWIFESNRAGVDVIGQVPRENVLTVREDRPLRFLADMARCLWKIRREKIDTVIDMELFSRFSALAGFLTGAPVRVGFHRLTLEGLYRGNLHTHRTFYNPYMHISANYLALVNALQAPPGEVPCPKRVVPWPGAELPRITPSPETRERVDRLLETVHGGPVPGNRVVVLNPGTSRLLPLRQWPLERYVELAGLLLQDPDLRVAIIGLANDAPLGERIAGEAGRGRCINLCGRTSFEELMAVLDRARLLISHDSGPCNFAALTRTHTIVLFGPETPVLYAPLHPNKTVIHKPFACSPCVSAFNHRKSLCTDNLCLQAISAQEVFEEARKFLYGPAGEEGTVAR